MAKAHSRGLMAEPTMGSGNQVISMEEGNYATRPRSSKREYGLMEFFQAQILLILNINNDPTIRITSSLQCLPRVAREPISLVRTCT